MYKQLDRHAAFYNLKEALEENHGCPVCNLQYRWTDSFIKTILYESVNDKFFRSRLAKTVGFCHVHAWRMAAFNSALGSAILFKDSLDRTIRTFADSKIKPEKKLEPCLLCENEKDAEQRYLQVLAGSIGQPDFWEIFETSDGVCVGHLKMLLDMVGKKDRQRLLIMHRKKLLALSETIGDYIETFDYRNEDAEASEEEKQSWKKAVAALVGREGII